GKDPRRRSRGVSPHCSVRCTTNHAAARGLALIDTCGKRTLLCERRSSSRSSSVRGPIPSGTTVRNTSPDCRAAGVSPASRPAPPPEHDHGGIHRQLGTSLPRWYCQGPRVGDTKCVMRRCHEIKCWEKHP
ncbi:unnamed protein product, partial [Scytosiphon promiscuus]